MTATGPTQEIALIYFVGCPHVEQARSHVREAVVRSGMVVEYREWSTSLPSTPAFYAQFASPTVLVNGLVVGGAVLGQGGCCAREGAPTVEAIITVLQAGPPGHAAVSEY